MMVIYLLTNTVNGKQYVGQTRRPLEKRLSEHRLNKKKNCLIDQKIDEYGWANFTVEVIEVCFTLKELNEWEQFWIKELGTKIPNGYNLTDGGDGILHYQHTDATKAILSKKSRGRKASEEARRKMSATRRGRHHSSATRRKMSLAQLGRRKSPEAVANNRAAQLKAVAARKAAGIPNPNTGRKHTLAARQKMSETKRRKEAERKAAGVPHPNSGRSISQEQKAMISETKRRKAAERRAAGLPMPRCGQKHTPEARRKMSETKRRRNAERRAAAEAARLAAEAESAPVQLSLFDEPTQASGFVQTEAREPRQQN